MHTHRSPVWDEVDRYVSFQHLADLPQHSFIVSPAADLMFEALAAVVFVWHKSWIIWVGWWGVGGWWWGERSGVKKKNPKAEPCAVATDGCR